MNGVPIHPPQTAPEVACHGPGCTTCGDELAVLTVAELIGEALAVVTSPQGTSVVSVALVDARPGDTVFVHAGEALAVAPPRGWR